MTNSTTTDLYAVMGNPIAHSKSPLIHRMFAEQTGQPMCYERRLVEIGQLPAALDQLRAEGGKGANITVPFKVDAWHYVTQLTERARLAGAVNTVQFLSDGSSLGDNTDGVGLLQDLIVNLKWPVENQRILIIGAGGAVRGILPALLNEKPEEIVLANRTVSKAIDLAKEFATLGHITACSFTALAEQTFQLIINATATSLLGEVPPVPSGCVTMQTRCYDLAYSDQLTAFLQWAKRSGCQHYADGLGMLVEQAAEAFFLWRGMRPNTAPIIQTLRDNQR